MEVLRTCPAERKCRRAERCRGSPSPTFTDAPVCPTLSITCRRKRAKPLEPVRWMRLFGVNVNRPHQQIRHDTFEISTICRGQLVWLLHYRVAPRRLSEPGGTKLRRAFLGLGVNVYKAEARTVTA